MRTLNDVTAAPPSHLDEIRRNNNDSPRSYPRGNGRRMINDGDSERRNFNSPSNRDERRRNSNASSGVSPRANGRRMGSSSRIHTCHEARSPERRFQDVEDHLSRRRSENTELTGGNGRRTSNNDNMEVEDVRRLRRSNLSQFSRVNSKLDNRNERRNGQKGTPTNINERRTSGEMEYS